MWCNFFVVQHKHETKQSHSAVLHFHKKRSSRMGWELKFIRLYIRPISSPPLPFHNPSRHLMSHTSRSSMARPINLTLWALHPSIYPYFHKTICWFIYGPPHQSSSNPSILPAVFHFGIRSPINPPIDISIHPQILASTVQQSRSSFS